MTTQVITVNENWQNLSTLVGIANGDNFLTQNIGSAQVYIAEATGEPNATDRGFVLKPVGEPQIFAQGAESYYVRVAFISLNSANASQIVVQISGGETPEAELQDNDETNILDNDGTQLIDN